MGRTPVQASDSRGGSAGARAYGRTKARVLPLVPLLLSGVLLTACSGGSAEEKAGGAKPSGAADRGVAFATCMRENGVAAFPDPADDGSLMVGKDSGVDPKSAEFKKAEEACKELSPQGGDGSDGGAPADLGKAREWAQCVRDNGVPKFPDPELKGDTLEVDMTGVGADGEDRTLDKALETCQDERPAGNLRMRHNGGGR
ncbi:hypothetical protein ACFYT4_06045 [Streptomyces sp. NPDC004609]|uniref:hypothetical protein n=1 Tax=Streptomyces sp. NPDC004609 TaxID=3364704 RepID=UPI0036B9CB9C